MGVSFFLSEALALKMFIPFNNAPINRTVVRYFRAVRSQTGAAEMIEWWMRVNDFIISLLVKRRMDY